MMTVKQVSSIAGVSIRTLQYYDKIGLLHPAEYSDYGYRLYDDTVLEKLGQIMLFRELEFSLNEIKSIINSPDFDREKALEQQIELLTLKKQRTQRLINLAREIKTTGVNKMSFNAFDESKIKEYSEQAKAQWGNTAEYNEYQKKSKNRSAEQENSLGQRMMMIFTEFGDMLGLPADCETVQNQVKKLQDFITENYYNCSNEILLSLGCMYADGGDFTKNIDKAGGEGTAVFVNEAVKIYCND